MNRWGRRTQVEPIAEDKCEYVKGVIMELKEFGVRYVKFDLSRHEIATMHQALNEVCNGFRVAAFELKMGGKVSEVDKIMDHTARVYRKMKRSGSPSASVRLSRFELRAIIGALKEVCREIDPIEFRTRMGATLAEVDAILDAIFPIYPKMKEAERLLEDN